MSARTVALQRFLLDTEARALKAESDAAQWEARWRLAFRDLQLAERVLHELRTGHLISLYACFDCDWIGRSNPYLQAEGG